MFVHKLINAALCLGMLLFMLIGFVNITEEDARRKTIGVIAFILMLICAFFLFKDEAIDYIGKLFG